MHPRRCDDVGVVDLDEQLVIYSGRTQQVHVLESVAAFIWESCDGQRSIDEIASLLREASPETDEETAILIVVQTLTRLGQLNLLADYG